MDVTDFLKALKNMPSAFVPSVFYGKWVKENKNRPSDVLKAQIDLKTMTWKDMLPVNPDSLTPELQSVANRPKIRPIQTTIGCEIQLESAEGIPLPEHTEGLFDRNMIVKRAVRIGVFDLAKREYLANAV